MKVIAKCGHEVQLTEWESQQADIVEYKKNFCCDACDQELAKNEKPVKQSLRDTMSGIANHYEEKGKKWNPINRTWK